MNESLISQVAALVTWPVVVLLGGLVFFWPLWNILKAFVGFIQRSRYCVGDAQTMGQICVKNVFSCRRDDKVQTKLREILFPLQRLIRPDSFAAKLHASEKTQLLRRS